MTTTMWAVSLVIFSILRALIGIIQYTWYRRGWGSLHQGQNMIITLDFDLVKVRLLAKAQVQSKSSLDGISRALT